MITNGYVLLEDQIFPERSFRRVYLEPFGETEWRALVEINGVEKPIPIFVSADEQEVRDQMLLFVGIKKPSKGPRRLQVITPELPG
jgi:hypothetical protein